MSHRYSAYILLIIFLVFLPQSITAQDFKTENGKAKFTSSVPLHTFSGTSSYLVGKISLADSTVDFYLDLSTLKTGIDSRDHDMYKTLNVEQHPFAEFFGKLITPFNPKSDDRQKVKVRGDFSINGVNRTITIDGFMQRKDNGLLVEASWQLKLDDYNIEPPGVLFYRVDSTQDISIKTLLKPANN